MSLAQDLAGKVGPHHRLLASAFYLAALVWLSTFSSFDRKTEVEEHALIPGYALPTFEGKWTTRLRDRIRSAGAASSVEAALDEALLDAELVSHRMDYSVLGGLNGSLTYTVASSSRGDSREACVVVVVLNYDSIAEGSWGVAIGATLAQHLRMVSWLSKDIFVVFVDGSLPYGAGVRAWLRSYFGGSSAVRRGVLRQAVVLDTMKGPTHLLADVEGINGAVPNQDIVNAWLIEARDKRKMVVQHRGVWESAFHHLGNGGVHSSHAPFLEMQVPAFTILGQKTGKKGIREIDPDMLAKSVEGIVRCFSNNLQQLHHSFNFYFYTGQRRHISSGIYLYPVFAMQLPLLSFLMTSSAYREIRSFLLGLGTLALAMLLCGSPVFLLATNPGLVERLAMLGPQAASFLEPPPACAVSDFNRGREAAATWLASGLGAALLLSLVMRQYAWRVFEPPREVTGLAEAQGGKGVRLSAPLWEAVRASSGFAFLITLAPLTISSWSVAVPLTLICVPMLILARPFSLRHRAVRSLLLAGFLAANAFLITAPPELRSEVLQGSVVKVATKAHEIYTDTILPAVPNDARPFLPEPLVRWLWSGALTTAMEGDFMLALYESARDFNCVGGMLFPVFCFVYWPFLVVISLVVLVLPAQRVDNSGLSGKDLRLGGLFVFLALAAAFSMGIVWRSYSSQGFGTLNWG